MRTYGLLELKEKQLGVRVVLTRVKLIITIMFRARSFVLVEPSLYISIYNKGDSSQNYEISA